MLCMDYKSLLAQIGIRNTLNLEGVLELQMPSDFWVVYIILDKS